ncbi:MAG: AAA family ATPase [Clostridiales bacterium]|nr:AAA family ATPase [Clostridiales bacterium]
MGKYVNPEVTEFPKTAKSSYVDKTGIISYLNDRLDTSFRFICDSRPRRFGKTTTAAMLVEYYKAGADSKELFAGLNIEKDPKFLTHINRYNVIYINIADVLTLTQNKPEKVTEMASFIVCKELKAAFGHLKLPEHEFILGNLAMDIYIQTRVGFVFIIDEWDALLRAANSLETQRAYIDFLRFLLKDKGYVTLAYITGLLPIKKYGGSGMSIFTEFSMTSPCRLASYMGFTEPEVKALCKRHDVSFKKVKDLLDGYLLGGKRIYAPLSVMSSVTLGFSSLWTETEAYETLMSYIDLNYDGLKEAITLLYNQPEARRKINTGRFQQTVSDFTTADDVLALLVHLGYLAFDESTSEVFIPNNEVRRQFECTFQVMAWTQGIELTNDSKIVFLGSSSRNG